jgi:hypothetical protein
VHLLLGEGASRVDLLSSLPRQCRGGREGCISCGDLFLLVDGMDTYFLSCRMFMYVPEEEEREKVG